MAVLVARLMGVLCLGFAMLPTAMALDDTPPVFRSAVALVLTFAGALVLFLASGNRHVLTPLGRIVLLATSAFLTALYGSLAYIGFFT